jgi:hypothetical protein
VIAVPELAPDKRPKEVEMPPRAAELPVGHGLQADRLLGANDRLDLAVFNLPQRGVADLLCGVSGARFLDPGRA